MMQDAYQILELRECPKCEGDLVLSKDPETGMTFYDCQNDECGENGRIDFPFSRRYE